MPTDESRDLPERLQRSPEAAVRVGDFLAFLDVVDRRLERYESSVTAEIAQLRNDSAAATLAHLQEHVRGDSANAAEHKEFRTFIDAAELKQAYADGFWGFVRLTFTYAHRYYKGVLAVAILLGILGGNFHLDVRPLP